MAYLKSEEDYLALIQTGLRYQEDDDDTYDDWLTEVDDDEETFCLPPLRLPQYFPPSRP